MKRRWKVHMNLRRQILTLTMLSFLLVAVYIFAFCYQYFVRTLHTKLLSSVQSDVDFVSEKIQRTQESGMGLAEWVYFNDDLYQSLRNYDPSKPQSVYSLLRQQEAIQEQLRFTPIGGDVSAIVIHGFHGGDLFYGNPGNLTADSVTGSAWFADMVASPSQNYWNRVFPLATPGKQVIYVLPLIQYICGSTGNVPAGWCLIAYRESMFSDVLSGRGGQGRHIFVMNSSGVCVSSQDKSQLGRTVMDSQTLATILKTQNGTLRYPAADRQGRLVFRTSGRTGLIVAEKVSLTQLTSEIWVFIESIVVVIFIALLLYIPITILSTRNITRPIQMLLAHMKRISKGDFRPDPSLEFDSEIGELGTGINQMARSISSLMEQQVSQEKMKKELEIQVLQAQINPHFLYNTLNTIKWMAIVQHAGGISSMVGALSRLLQNLSHGTDQLIPLEEEFAIVRDYMSIQELRYSGRLKLENGVSPEMAHARIIKFTLQPIVENAIFHGIEPKTSAGVIRLSAERVGDDLFLHVRDDGVGMSREAIDRIFSEETPNRRGLSGIGLHNVDERIRLTYGVSFGLSVQSMEGEYTDVCVHIPYSES